MRHEAETETMFPLPMDVCVLHVAHWLPLHRKEVEIFSWRCLSCLINAVAAARVVAALHGNI